MEKLARRHFFHHGSDGLKKLAAEKLACHWCQIRSLPLQDTIPLSIVNEAGDGAILPPDFTFIDQAVLRDGVKRAEDSFRSGCQCSADGRGCQYGTCSCLSDVVSADDDSDEGSGRRNINAYVSQGPRKGMLKDSVLNSPGAIYECHSMCKCGPGCPNRVVERGRTLPLQVFRTSDRGWGVRSPEPIKKGQFVDCYIGEVLTHTEADQRRTDSDLRQRKDVYLFALDKFTDPDSFDPRLRGRPLEVDGEFMSGPTRFINHSCDPNLRIFARVGDHADKHLHDLALFALRDVGRLEELTFDYVDGVTEPDEAGDKTKCLCGSKKCRGYLW